MTKLEKYLADYIEQEKMGLIYDDGYELQIDADTLQEIIKQGLDAFESTENVRVFIWNSHTGHIGYDDYGTN